VLATRNDLLDGRVQMINWARLPVGSSFRAHYHEDMEETFILIQGQAEMRIEQTTLMLGPGDTVIVAPREVHTMKNIGPEAVEYIVVGITLGHNGKTIVVDTSVSP
jgi:mannose-6-phosphate isomerase-like protein (cupin superfamily)